MSPLRTPAKAKLFNRDALASQIVEWRRQGDRIVFTNGCFDILHIGHIQYLEAAAAHGDRLIIAVNEDASVRQLKGETRPINTLSSRMYLLASLTFVDAVLPFAEETPLEVILAIKPDVIVKGGDYTEDTIVGAQEVKSWGGEVAVIPFVQGHSTTSIENKILSLHKHKTNES
jgi:D-beta-D-heptose 7-phosphate kinase/D-beta-D-heptose 1-phosphate adenosyltransferase